MRLRHFIILTGIIGATVWIASAQKSQPILWSKRIVSKTKHPLASFFSSCPNYVNVLSIDSKRFENVRGIKDFYLRVPDTDMICFVTDEGGGAVTYHLFNMDNDEDIGIRAKSSYFGQTIGSTNCQDIIEAPRGAKITLYNVDKGGKSTLPELADLASIKWTCTLDLVSRKVLVQKTLYFDRQGKVIMQRDESPPF